MSGLFVVAVDRGDASPIAHVLANGLVHAKHHRVGTVLLHPRVAVGSRRIGLRCERDDTAASEDACVRVVFSGALVPAFGAPVDRPVPQRTDADLALDAYLQRGVDGLTRLRGEYVVIVWDGRRQELIVVNDRHGLRPHYFARTERGFVVSPEVKAICRFPGLRPTIDRVALAQYLRFQHLLGERTFLNEVKLLAPASVLRYRLESGCLQADTYWRWDGVECQELSLEDAAAEVSSRFHHAVNARIEANERAGVFLSGGLDSRLIVAFLQDASNASALTFGTAGCRDVHYSSRIARCAGVSHHWFPLEGPRWVLEHAALHLTLTEGFHSWIHMHGISMLEHARTLIDVNLTGWCGGTSFRGYMEGYEADRSIRSAPSEAELVRRFHEGFCRRFTWPGLTDDEATELTSRPGDSELPSLARTSLAEELGRTAGYRPDIRADLFYLLTHVRRQTQYFVVFKRSAIEVRCPYFDYDLMDLLYSLPLGVRAAPDLYRTVLTRRSPGLALIPGEANLRLPHERKWVRDVHSLLPRGTAWLRRRGVQVGVDRPRLYADYEEYLRTDLRAWGEALLFDGRAAERGLFNPSVVRSLWDRHQSGRELWTIGKIAPLMAIEQVMRYFIDDEPAQTAAVPLSVG